MNFKLFCSAHILSYVVAVSATTTTMSKGGYDRHITIFSPEGRLYQIGGLLWRKHHKWLKPPRIHMGSVCGCDMQLPLYRAWWFCSWLAEYAFKAVKESGLTSLGLRGTNSCVVVGQKKIPVRVLIQTTIVHVCKSAQHVHSHCLLYTSDAADE